MNLTQEISDFISELVINQNNTNEEILKNLTSKQEYLNLLSPLIELLNNQEITVDSIATLKALLIEKSGIKQLIKDIVHKTGATPGLVLDFGTLKNREIFAYGLKQEVEILNNKKVFNPQEIKHNTLFDLASTSKIFTCLAILKLVEENLLALNDPITKYVPEFKELTGITINDLLKFKTPIKTKVRIDTAKTKEEAERILFSAYPSEEEIYNAYTDIGAMILRYVVERKSKMTFKDFVATVILKPLNMTDTFLNVPNEAIERVASENFSTIIDSYGIPLTITDNIPGTPHDSKAKAMGHYDGIAPGHAGYFSSARDMITLGNALCDNSFLKKQTVMSISENEVGKKLANDDYSWYYGSLVYVKQPTLGKYPVYAKMSGRCFMSPGFSGTLLYVDPLNKITLFIGANRLHDRIYKIHPNYQKNIHLDEETHKAVYEYPNGSQQIISLDFALEREKIVQKALDLAIQLKLLEKIYEHLTQEKGMSLTLEK